MVAGLTYTEKVAAFLPSADEKAHLSTATTWTLPSSQRSMYPFWAESQQAKSHLHLNQMLDILLKCTIHAKELDAWS